MNRRYFLKRVIKVFFLILILAVLSVIVYIYPSSIKKRRLQYVYVLDEDDLPKRGVRKVEFEYKSDDKTVAARVYIVMRDKGLVVFSPVCTHLGCLVYWDNNKKEFLCPCHGGRYDINGDVISGPPPRSLTRLPIEIKDGKVYIGIKV
ncbi:MAG: ubiquinol-cytochrome c reductase iron-sulfur subunit [Thermodesulfovibrionales bacterium]|nr:ubiquinol-cytochrome c reductase iron-sulfur subunit [Thermodesulfovibrionales bacterium]